MSTFEERGRRSVRQRVEPSTTTALLSKALKRYLETLIRISDNNEKRSLRDALVYQIVTLVRKGAKFPVRSTGLPVLGRDIYPDNYVFYFFMDEIVKNGYADVVWEFLKNPPLEQPTILGPDQIPVYDEGKEGPYQRWPRLNLLHSAADSGQESVARVLLNLGANANAKGGTWDITPLIFAARHGNEGLIRALLEKGANPTALTRENITALHVVTDVEETKDYYGTTSDLHDAVLSALLEKVNDPTELDLQDEYGNTALHFAAKARFGVGVNMVRMLLARGANPNVRNERGKTPLHDAASSAVARVLVAHRSIEPNIEDTNGDTPLHLAVEKGWYGKETVPILMNLLHIDLNVQNRKGDTPLMIAKKKIEEIRGGRAEPYSGFPENLEAYKTFVTLLRSERLGIITL